MVYKTMVPWTMVENHGLYVTMVPLTGQPRVVYKTMVPRTSVENHGL
jgi:aromatic ring-cleaving dioxygenase